MISAISVTFIRLRQKARTHPATTNIVVTRPRVSEVGRARNFYKGTLRRRSGRLTFLVSFVRRHSYSPNTLRRQRPFDGFYSPRASIRRHKYFGFWTTSHVVVLYARARADQYTHAHVYILRPTRQVRAKVTLHCRVRYNNGSDVRVLWYKCVAYRGVSYVFTKTTSKARAIWSETRAKANGFICRTYGHWLIIIIVCS